MKPYAIPHNDLPDDSEMTEIYASWLRLESRFRESCRRVIKAIIESLQEAE